MVTSNAIGLWEDIIKIYKHWESLLKSRRPRIKNYFTVLEAIRDPLRKAKFHFFSHVAKITSSFLQIYQTQKPMITFLFW